jgi:hypothetical protein
VSGCGAWCEQLDAIGKAVLLFPMATPKVGADVVRRYEEGDALVAGCNDELNLDARHARQHPVRANWQPIQRANSPWAKDDIRQETVLQPGARANGEIRGLEQRDAGTQSDDDTSDPEGLRFQLHHVLIDQLDGLADRRGVADLSDRDSRQVAGCVGCG